MRHVSPNYPFQTKESPGWLYPPALATFRGYKHSPSGRLNVLKYTPKGGALGRLSGDYQPLYGDGLMPYLLGAAIGGLILWALLPPPNGNGNTETDYPYLYE